MSYWGNTHSGRRGALRAVLLAFCLASCLGAVPRAAWGQFGMRSFGEEFDMSVSQSIEAERGSVIIVSAAIDHRHLVFFRKDGFYEARYRVYMDLEKEDGAGPAGEVWEETVTVGTYRETRSPDMRSLMRRSFEAGPGEYKVRVIIEVLGTSRRYKREEKIRVVGADEGMVRLSEPGFYSSMREATGRRPERGELAFSLCGPPGENGFRQVQGAVFVDIDSWLRIDNAMIIPPSMTGRELVISCRIIDSRGKTMAYNRQRVVPAGKVERFCYDMNVDHLDIGFYTCSVSVTGSDPDEKTSEEEPFVILLNRGLFRENFPDLLSLLSVIADDEELEALREAPVEERMQQWNLFWENRAPSSGGDVNEGLSEFLRRVKYTLKAFSRNRPGWETDMGKVFIRNGRPDRITDRSGNQYAIGSTYQLWYYDSRGLVYIFQNTMGGGEYRLIDTQMY